MTTETRIRNRYGLIAVVFGAGMAELVIDTPTAFAAYLTVVAVAAILFALTFRKA